MNNVEIWLWILLVMLPHNPRTAELLKRYGSALATARAMRDGECDDTLTEQEKKRVERTRSRDVKALISDCEKLDIRIVTLDDTDYPTLLKNISNPPIVLFVKGNIAPLSNIPTVAVVGPRNASEYGRKVCTVLCGDLAKNGIGIVSGLAVGIDAAAHRAAVDHNAYTVGILGCGLTVNYPAENEELKQTILEKGGALISELLPTAAVNSSYFKQRNRIIAGIAMGTLIVEASTRSGALLTAEHTFKQDKPVFVIPPHDIFQERFCGVFPLLKNGAMAISGIGDICSTLSDVYSKDKTFENTLSAAAKATDKKTPAKPKTAKSTPIKLTPPTPKVDQTEETASKKTDISSIDPKYAKLAEALLDKPMTMDELIVCTSISHDEICGLLLEMELDDIITRKQDATYSLK